MTDYQLYIDGAFVRSHTADTIAAIDPSTNEAIARAPDADTADVDRAARAARRAFDQGPWKEATAQDRGRVLFALARAVRDRAAELAELETRNNGKPIV